MQTAQYTPTMEDSFLDDADVPPKGGTMGDTMAGPDLDRLKGMKVLLAEDNVVNQRVAQKLFSKIGLDVDIVFDGEAAVAAANAQPYDLIVMDIEMPDMDGIAATNHIRSLLPDDRVPYIVALTANAMNSERDNYLKSGMDDYLSKPIDVEALTESLVAAKKLREKRAAAR